MAIVDSLLPEFDHEMTVTRKLLERVPEERFGWKPHEKSFTLGQLAQHVATVPMWGSITINQSELDLGGGQQLPAVTERCGTPRALRRSRRGHPRRTRGEIGRRAHGAVDAQTQRQDAVLDAQGGGVAIVRHEPSHSPPRSVERLPADSERAASVDVRSER